MTFPSFCSRVLNELGSRARVFDPSAEFRFVGGCVRDTLLGRKVKDWDLVTNVNPDVLESMGLESVGVSFPVYLYSDLEVGTMEVACCRTETKVGDGHKGFSVQVVNDFDADALRRDLTVNTLWLTVDGVRAFNPQALKDLEDKKLDVVTDAFSEDPLRVFRVARFCAQLGSGWSATDRTLEAMAEMSDGLGSLSAERVRNELEKALVSDRPSLFFQCLRDGGCLSTWFPELEAMVGVDHGLKYHPEGDVWNHMMLVLDRGRELGLDLMAMLGLLAHDFGKGRVPKDLWPKMHNHEMLGAQPVAEFCARLNYGHQVKRVMTNVAKYHTHVHKVADLRPVTRARLLMDLKRLPLSVATFGTVCMADAQGRGEPFNTEPYPQAQMLVDFAAKMDTVDFSSVPNMTRQKAEVMYAKVLR